MENDTFNNDILINPEKLKESMCVELSLITSAMLKETGFYWVNDSIIRTIIVKYKGEKLTGINPLQFANE